MAVALPPLAKKSVYDKRHRLRKASPAWRPPVPAAQVQHHTAAVRDATGMTIRQFAALAGIHREHLATIIRGERTTVLGATAAKIFAVTAESRPRSGWIDATGTRRRLQALAYAGWPLDPVAEAAVLSLHTLRSLRRGEYGTVLPGTAGKVAGAYRRLWPRTPPEDTPGQRLAVARARSLARRQGWAPGAAWEDIDDPADRPRGLRPDLRPPQWTRPRLT